MSEQHLLESPADAARRLLKTMSNDNQIVDQRAWLDAMEDLRRSLTVPRSQQPAEVAALEVPDNTVYAVTLKGKRIALASLRENAEHAARSEPAAVVVPCRLVPIAGPEAFFAGLTPTATHHHAAGDTRRELDMAMIVRRIVSSARRHCDGNSPVRKLANEAWDYIYRSGLGGSPLRDAALPAATGLTGAKGHSP